MSDPAINQSQLQSDELKIGRLRRRALAWKALSTGGKAAKGAALLIWATLGIALYMVVLVPSVGYVIGGVLAVCVVVGNLSR